MRILKNIVILILSTFLVISCADDGDPIHNEIKGWNVQKLYNEAYEALSNKSYDRAIKLYNALETTYPYGIYAQQGMLDLSYAYYKSDKPEMALASVEQFIVTYPTNSSMDYALYLKGYINYKSDDGFFTRLTKQDESELDPLGLQEAYKAFSELVTRYPNSKYANDSKQKVNLVVNDLAMSQMHKARYYMTIKAYLAAIDRSQTIITTYTTTSYVEEALAMQVLAYQNLGQMQLSIDTKKVLALNFPQSKYLHSKWRDKDKPWYAIF
jgi:outer membrane protein assembly factor BamD